MKIHILLVFAVCLLAFACKPKIDKEALKKEVFDTEKAFELAAKEKGVPEAFHEFAAPDAVILRAGDSIISGKEGILNFYQQRKNNNATVSWTPDFIDVSDDGTLGYTYGKYCWKIPQEDNTVKEYKGIFHTVWKKQPDGSWKYVWD